MTLALWGEDTFTDDRPLPEIISDKYRFPLQSHDADGQRFYAVQDWVRGIAQSDDVRNLISKLKKRAPEMSPSWLRLSYRAEDGKTYKRDFSDAEGLYAITQRMDSNTGLRSKVLAFLAKAGVFADDARRNPAEASVTLASRAEKKYQQMGKSDRFIATRFQGIVGRNELTDAMRDHIPDIQRGDYGKVTNALYRLLWGRDANELRADIGIGKDASLRDHQSVEALAYQMLLESAIAHQLKDRQTVRRDEIASIVEAVGAVYARQAAETSRLFGRDIATDKPLITSGD